MKRPIPGKHLPKPDVNLSDAQSIDVKYGLEPVIEPSVSADDGGAPGGMQFHLVECPYCGESFETPVDTSSGSARYVEDCQIPNIRAHTRLHMFADPIQRCNQKRLRRLYR